MPGSSGWIVGNSYLGITSGLPRYTGGIRQPAPSWQMPAVICKTLGPVLSEVKVLVAVHSAEILHQHDVAIDLICSSEENPLAIGRNRETSAACEALFSIHGGESFHLPGTKIEEINLG